MDVQTVIVGIIILAALVYAARMTWKKVRGFSSKAGCGTNCGCDGAAEKPKNLLTQINRR
jgi:hypothetical protein